MFPWHQEVKNRILSNFNNKCLGHANLLKNNSQGLGANDFACSIVKYILCNEASSCGSCKSCKLLEHNSHPDLLIVKPEKKIITISQIRELNLFLQKKPIIAKHKIVIIESACKMNQSASNCLLKTLEEPAVAAYLFLTVDDITSVQATIRSRCQIYNLQNAKKDELKLWLHNNLLKEDNLTQDKNLLDLALSLSYGSNLRAKNYLDNDFLEAREEIIKLYFELLENKTYIVDILEKLSSIDMDIILEVLTSIHLDAIYISLGQNAKVGNIDIINKLASFYSKYDYRELLTIYSEIINIHKQSKAINSNKELRVYNLLSACSQSL